MNGYTAPRVILDKPGRARVYDTILDTIGNTPLVRIGRLAREAGCQGEVLAKLEFFNPLGSVKDRIALSMLEAMEEAGTIGPGSVIVEPTSGNLGVGLAFACAAKGYRCVLTTPEGISGEQRELMCLLGAEVVLSPRGEGLQGAVAKAKEIVAATPKAAMPWQFGHPANPEIHRRTTAEEIWRDTNGIVDALVLGVGSGGTLTGVAAVLKERNPQLLVVAVEAEHSAVPSDVLDRSLIDEVMRIGEDEAITTSRRLAALEGIPAGVLSGAALAAAMQVAARPQMKGLTAVTLLPDAAERHLSTVLRCVQNQS